MHVLYHATSCNSLARSLSHSLIYTHDLRPTLRAYAYTYANTPPSLSVKYTPFSLYTYMYAYIHVYHIYIYVHVGMHACLHACRHVCMYACMHVFMHSQVFETWRCQILSNSCLGHGFDQSPRSGSRPTCGPKLPRRGPRVCWARGFRFRRLLRVVTGNLTYRRGFEF